MNPTVGDRVERAEVVALHTEGDAFSLELHAKLA